MTKCCACHENRRCSSLRYVEATRQSRHASIKYCVCHAKRKRNRNPCHKTQQNHAICDESISKRWFCHILWAPPNGERLSALTAVAVVETPLGISTTPTSRPPGLNQNPSQHIRETCTSQVTNLTNNRWLNCQVTSWDKAGHFIPSLHLTQS